MTRSYQSPEVLELGAAEALTLGSTGCTADGKLCEYWPDNDGIAY